MICHRCHADDEVWACWCEVPADEGWEPDDQGDSPALEWADQ